MAGCTHPGDPFLTVSTWLHVLNQLANLFLDFNRGITAFTQHLHQVIICMLTSLPLALFLSQDDCWIKCLGNLVITLGRTLYGLCRFMEGHFIV